MLKLTHRKNGTVRTFPDDALADICLGMGGGGYTNAQTIKAMTIKASFEKNRTVRTFLYLLEEIKP